MHGEANKRVTVAYFTGDHFVDGYFGSFDILRSIYSRDKRCWFYPLMTLKCSSVLFLFAYPAVNPKRMANASLVPWETTRSRSKAI